MGRFAVRRIVQGMIVILGVTVVVFVVTRLVGDPVDVLLPLEATDEQRAAFEHELGFDRPILIQFGNYMGDVVTGDFGESIWQSRPAMEIVLEHLPRTFQLVLPAMALMVLFAVPLGILAALRPGKLSDRITVVLSLAGLSIPQFWLGLLLIIVFAVELQWLPPLGFGSVQNLILPVVTLALPAIGRLAMIVRSSMIDELNQQYVKTATAKGIPYSRVVAVHALRNAGIPAITLTGWETIRALAGYSVIVETVFQWPGLGFLAIQSIERQDLVLLQAIVFVIALMVVVVNVTVDILYKAVDPRIKLA
jgi:peptide/nickel transport system permease protein